MTGRCRRRRRCRCKSFVSCFLFACRRGLGGAGGEGGARAGPSPRGGGRRRDWGSSCFLTHSLPHFPRRPVPRSPHPFLASPPAARGLPLPGGPGTRPRCPGPPPRPPAPSKTPAGDGGGLLAAAPRASGAFAAPGPGSLRRVPLPAFPGCPRRAQHGPPSRAGGCWGSRASSEPGVERGPRRASPFRRRPPPPGAGAPGPRQPLPRRPPRGVDGIRTGWPRASFSRRLFGILCVSPGCRPQTAPLCLLMAEACASYFQKVSPSSWRGGVQSQEPWLGIGRLQRVFCVCNSRVEA